MKNLFLYPCKLNALFLCDFVLANFSNREETLANSCYGFIYKYSSSSTGIAV